MKHLLSLERLDVGRTLALTVGSPSAHRRGTMLKHITVLVLILTLGFGQVWAAVTGSIASSISDGDQVILVNTSEANEFTGVSSSNTGSQASYNNKIPNGTCVLTVETGKYGSGNYSLKLSDGSYLAYTTTATSSNNKLWKLTLPTSPSDDQKKQVSWTISFNASNEVTITNVYNTGRKLRFNSDRFCCYTSNQTAVKFFKLSGTNNPTVSASPEAVNNVVAAGVNNQSISLSYENISGYTTAVSVHPNADGTGTLSPAWLSASISSPYSTVSYTVSANSGAARTAYIKVRATASGNKEATTIIPVSQVKYTEPTGTFNKYTGETLVEGEYVICSGTSTTAMKNAPTTGTNIRIDAATVTINNNNAIVNPDESVVWKLEYLSGDDAGYFTLYNEAVEKYAAFTSTDGRGNVIETATDYAKWQLASNTSYELINKGKTGKYLRYNNGVGFASYASSTGATLTLYKKALPTHKVTFTATPTGGTVAVSVGGSSISTNADVEEGSTVTITPTPSSHYKIASVTKGGVAISPVNDVYSFTMPNSDVAIAVTFELIPVTAVTLNKSVLELVEGATETLSVNSVTPGTARNTVTWSSTNTNVATVTNAGLVTAVAAGSATIKATSTVSTTVFGSCALTVTAPQGHAITITQNTGGNVTANVAKLSDVVAGTSVTLTATPDDGYSFNSWTVLDGNADEITPTAQSGNTFTFDMPDGEVLAEATFTHEVAVLKLHDANGETTYDSGNTHYWKESVTLPSTAAACSKTFMGWSANAECSTAPEIAKGASYTIPNKGTNDLYAVYAAIEDEDVTITPSACTGSADPFSFTIDQTGYTLSANKNSGSSNPAWNGTDSDVRVYATGDITLASSTKTMKSIVFNLSTQGKKRLAPITASTGTIATQAANDETVTWTGSATTVTFTVGAKADYGSDGSTKAGQLDFSTIDVVVAGEPSDYSTTCAQQLDAPTFSVTADTYYEAKTIHINAADGATIYYTTDGSKPSTGSAVFSADIELNTRAITTIKAIAVKAGYANSSVASATYNINLPYEVDAFIELGNSRDGKEYAVSGIISAKESSLTDGKLTYYISKDGSTENQVTCYQGLKLNKAAFDAIGDVNLGDNVTVVGTWSNYYSNLQSGNWMYAYTARVAAEPAYEIAGGLTESAFDEGEAFDAAILNNLSVNALFTNGYKEAVDGVTFTYGEKTTWEAGDETLTVTAVKNETNLVSRVFGVTVTSATLESIALKEDDGVYQTKKVYYVGDDFVAPTIVATLSDNNQYEATASYVSGFDKTNPGVQSVTVSYTRGDNTETTSYNVTVKAIYNNESEPHTVAKAIEFIEASSYNYETSSPDYMWVSGIVSQVNSNVNNNGTFTYYISDNGSTTGQLQVYNGKYFGNVNFVESTKVAVGDQVTLKATILRYHDSKDELTSSQVTSQLRNGALDVPNVAAFEVGQPDLAEADLNINRHGSTGAITFSCEENEALEIVENKLHAKGEAEVDVEVTATMAEVTTTGVINFTEVSTTFTVHVVPAQDRYEVTFAMDGGSPTPSLGDQLENADVIIPAGTYTKDGYKFNGWAVMAGETPVAVTETAGVYSFSMPAAAVTVTAQWVAGSDFAWVASDKGYENAQDITTATEEADPISIVFAKETAQNGPKYYTSGTAVRTYAGNTLTIATKSDTKLINKITFTYGDKNVVADGLSEDKLTWTGLAKEVVLTTSGGQAHFKTITVTYINGTVTTLSINNINLKTSDNATPLVIEKNVEATIIYEGLDESVATIANNAVTPVGIGSTTVTARIAQGANYTAAETEFTITVAAKTIPEMSFPQASYDANLGESFTAPTLTKPEGVSVAYSSDNAAVSVDENTGAITLNAEGTAVITATSVENNDYAVGTATYTLNVIDPNKDVLTASAIGVTGSYSDWDEKSFTSAVVYAGNSTTATGVQAGAIQMRTTNSNSGIVVTSSIGYLKALSATRNNDAGTLEVYAKSNAYESAADLYDANKQGTLIGTITTGAMSFEDGKAYADKYKYIGIKSASGAVYYDDITIEWTPADFPEYTVTYQAGTGATGTDVEVEDIEENTIIQLSEKPEGFSYANHVFTGWKLDGDGDLLEAGSDYEVTDDATFVAQWAEAYTVTYQAGEAEGDDVPVQVAAGEYHLAACTFEAPENKMFIGWKLNGEGDLLGVGASYTISEAVNFVAQWATVGVVTFDATVDISETTNSIEKDGIIITASKFDNTESNKLYYQCYSGSKMTVESEVGEIVKIELTCTGSGSSDYSPSKFSFEGYTASGNVGIWVGSAENVDFGNASGQVRMTQIEVTYLPNGVTPKQKADLSYAQTNYEITVGDPFTAPMLTNPHDLAVTYSGNKPALATIDAATGAITLAEGQTGTVTVTASFEGDDNYKAGSASYTLKVKDISDDVRGSWKRVTDATSLEDGMKIVIAEYQENPTSITTMGKNKGNNHYAIPDGTVSENVLTPAEGTSYFTLVALDGGNFAIKTTGGKYLYAASSSSNNLKEKAGLDENGNSAWAISIAADAHATILAQGTNNNKLMRYNKSGDGLFSCYANAETPSQQPIAIYAKNVKISGNTDASTLDDYADVTVPSGSTLVISTEKPLNDVTVKAGATVTVSEEVQANDMTVEVGGTITGTENVSVRNLVIKTRLETITQADAIASEAGASGQIVITGAGEISATNDAVIEIELTQEEAASWGWYAFSVPFPVDALNGVYFGDKKLTNEVDYAIMKYHEDLRAAGEYAWKKYRKTLLPGVLYFITVGNTDYKTLTFKKVSGEAIVASNAVSVSKTATSGEGASGWNGIGNPNLQVSHFDKTMQFFDHAHRCFRIRNGMDLMVGSAFMYQHTGTDQSVVIETGSASLAPARVESSMEKTTFEVLLRNVATGRAEDNVFLRTSETALSTYEIGRDLGKIEMGTCTDAQMYITAYGTKLCIADFPMVNGQVAYPLTITAPAAGTYNLSAKASDKADIYLTQEGAIIWNLSMSEYELDLTKGTTNGYGLLLVEKAPGIATGVDEISGEKAGVQKIVIEDKVFILRGGKMYDVTGKAVR